MTTDVSQITNPQRLFSGEEVLSESTPVPDANGLYGLYFKENPAGVPTEKCITSDDKTLLYVGISPESRHQMRDDYLAQTSFININTLKFHINRHYQNGWGKSPLRLALGVLLTKESGYPLRRVRKGIDMNFTRAGERWLNDWMLENAFVCCVEHEEPWTMENDLMSITRPPLNIKGNPGHPFSPTLRGLISEAIQKAWELPIHAPRSGQAFDIITDVLENNPDMEHD